MDDPKAFAPSGDFSIALVLDSQIENLRPVRWAVLSACQMIDLDQQSCSALELCAVEAVTNVIRHGHQLESGHAICFEIKVDSESVQLLFADQGTQIPAEKWEEAEGAADVDDIDSVTPGGRGLFLMREMMDAVEYRPGPPENLLILTKKRRSAG